jgi:hypothetical protein
MTQEFVSYLLGRYTNRDQAFYQPSKYAYIWGVYEQVSPTDIKSTWWYNYAGEDAPYREGYQRIVVSGNYITLENYTPEWKEKTTGGIIFTKRGTQYEGTNADDCFKYESRLESKMILTGNEILCYDAGVKEGKIVWGGKDLYTFKQVTDGL